MNSIKEIVSMLPIRYNDKEIDVLKYNDINTYVNIIMSEYYRKYMGDNQSLTREKVKEYIYNLVEVYELSLDINYEVRMLLKNSCNGNIIGGCYAIYNEDKKYIELSYFILKRYSGRNYCKEMVNYLITALDKTKLDHKYYKVNINSLNKASIKVVKDIGFVETNTYEDSTNTIIELKMSRKALTR